MNRSLIEDEKAETNLTFEQLKRRMEEFICSEYDAFLFDVNRDIVGYALCDMSKSPIYLRQFYICREKRRKGYGRQAFFALLAHLDIREMDLDIYSWNKTGLAFWESLGFEKRCYHMRYRR